MRYIELIKILQETYQIKTCMSADSPAIRDIRLLSSGEGHWNENILYVGNLEKSITPPDKPVMLLCVDEPPVLPKESNYALISGEDLYGLFNKAKDLIIKDIQGESIGFQLAHLALKGKSISHVINTAAEFMGNALILVDDRNRVLAYSTVYKIEDPLWAQNVERGYCSYEFVQKVRCSRDMKEWDKHGSEAQVITLAGDKQPKLVARITQGGHIAGALVMVAHHRPIEPAHLQQLPQVGRLLMDVFNRDSVSVGVYGSFYSAILYNLLDEAEILDTLEHITMSKIDFPAEMRIVVARYIHHMDNRYLKHTFSLELERIFPKGHSVYYKSYIGILVPSVSQKQREDLAGLAHKEDVSIGLSWPFTDIMEFKRHFYQAVTSIKLAQRFGQASQVFDYSDYYYYDLLYNYKGKSPLEHYCHPALKTLREYDRASNTDLYNTLRTYLEHGKNLRTTAEALFIHRNTLNYRIQRINQLISLDLNSVNVLHSLMNSFRIEIFLSQEPRDS